MTELPDTYRLAKPTLYFTGIDFLYSRSALQRIWPEKPPPPSSNECPCGSRPPDFLTDVSLALCWIADSSSGSGQEVIINGVRRGVGAKQRGVEKHRLVRSGFPRHTGSKNDIADRDCASCNCLDSTKRRRGSSDSQHSRKQHRF